MDYKKSYARLHLGVLFAVLLALCAVSFHMPALLLGGIAAAVFSIVQAKKYYKCPHCGKPLSLWAVMPQYCPQCGGCLREG